MSLNKSCEHKKEWRKPYYKSKRFDRACRPHGSCNYCRNNRLHSTMIRELIAKDKEQDV